ncbi:MAG: protein tyrosine phosphatase [Pseudomonadota bacterium]
MIYVTPLSRLDDTLRVSGARSLLTLLSIDAPFTPPQELAPGQWLRISMHDLAEPRHGFVAPSEAHVAEILDFGRAWDRRAPLIVHCHAGISRSTAAAYVIAAALQPDRDEAELARDLRKQSPSATPNPMIIAHADKLLDRDGRMVRAIAAIGRGAEAFEGTPFVLAT